MDEKEPYRVTKKGGKFLELVGVKDELDKIKKDKNVCSLCGEPLGRPYRLKKPKKEEKWRCINEKCPASKPTRIIFG